MKRHITTIISTPCLIVCAGIVMLWASSYWGSNGIRLRMLDLVMLFLTVIIMIVPLFWLHEQIEIRRFQRRAIRGRCTNCGYDLCRTHWSKGCPECGTPNRIAPKSIGLLGVRRRTRHVR